MARGIIRKPSFNKIVGAYRSQWKRFWMRLFTFGMYGRKGMGWWRDPKKAWYNFWYHRTSISVYRLLGYKPSRLSCFFAIVCASVISIMVSPIDVTRAGVAAHKMKKERKARTEGASCRNNKVVTPKSQTSTTHTSSTSDSKSTKSTTYKKTPSHNSSSPVKSTVPQPKTIHKKSTTTTARITTPVVEEKKTTNNFSYTPLNLKVEPKSYNPPKTEEPKAPDENTPKSKPKHDGDQYIRKRMIIAGSSYCNKEVLERLTVGTYFELIAEPTNPYDKDAVMLVYEGEKIGYIAKQDKLAFVTCLKLKREIYGVITEIKPKSGIKQYEFETWFDYFKR